MKFQMTNLFPKYLFIEKKEENFLFVFCTKNDSHHYLSKTKLIIHIIT